MIRIAYISLIVLGMLQSAAAQVPLDTLVRRALQHAPSMEMYQWRIDAQRFREDVEGALPDPALQIQPLLQPIETKTGPQRLRIGGQQAFAWPGTYRTRKRIVEKEKSIIRARQRQTRRQIRTYIASLYYEGAYWLSYRRILKAQSDLLDMLDSMVKERFRQGQGSLVDIERIRIHRAELEFESRQARRHLKKIQSILRRWTQLASIRLPLLDSLPLPDLPGRDLADRLPDSNWTYVADSLAARQAQLKTRLATLTNRPAFTVGATYLLIEGGKNAIIAPAVGIKSPLFRKKNRARIHMQKAEATARFWQSRNTLRTQADRIDKLRTRFDVSRFSYTSHQHQATASIHSFRLLVTDYAAGHARFWEVVNMLNQVFQHRKMALQQQKNLYLTKLQMEQLIGTLK